MKKIGLVMAGGLGKRMKSSKPKVLHEVEGIPLVTRAIEAVRAGGAERLIAVLSHKADEVSQALPEDVEVVVQERPRGTASAIIAAEHLLDDESIIAVSFGDMPWVNPKSVARVYQALEDGADGAVLTYIYEDPPQFGRVIRDENGHFANLVQFKDLTEDQLAIREADAGLFAFRTGPLKRAVTTLDDNNAAGELYLTDAPAAIVRLGGQVACIEAEEIEETLGVNDRRHLEFANRIPAVREADHHLHKADEVVWTGDEQLVEHASHR